MRVGILTFHKVINYGAILQAYALNRYINDKGIDCEEIDYTAKKIRNFYNPFKIERFSDLKDLLDYVLNLFGRVRTEKRFKSFRSQYIKISKRCFDNCINEANGRYDLLICGSDQIWNNKITGNDLNYYFSFDTISRRASYAASIGVSKIDLNNEVIKQLLSSFSHITVREDSSISLLKNIISNEVRLVLDPVFLYSRNDWSVLAGDKRVVPYNYILLFNLKKNPEVNSFAKRLSHERGIKVVIMSNSFFYNHSFERVSGCGPIDFLSLIKFSDYVITDSFHATSLSILLNKVFFVGLNQQQLELNDRICSLLNMFGLQEQIISNQMNFEINYEQINTKIEIERQKSYKFIDNILSNTPFE